MRDLDDLIREHLERTARPPQPDQGLFKGIDQRRAQRAIHRRVRSGALAVVILALFAAAAVALSRSSGVAPATQSAPPPVAPLSPNGSLVVVESAAKGHHSLWSLDTAGDQLQLTSGANDLQPAVDPTGKTVAFSRTEGTNGTAGSAILTVPIGGGAVTRLLDASWLATDPAWSPDGTQIAFAGGGHLTGQSLSRPSGIYVMFADERGSPRLVYAGKTDFAVEGHPSWSPDGSRLVFEGGNAALSNPPNFDLYVINSDGSGSATDVTNSTESETDPSWSPDGGSIAFSLQPATAPGVVAQPAVTGSIALISAGPAFGVPPFVVSGRVVLTDGKALDTDPGWSPDGRLIAFARTIDGRPESPAYILEVTATGRPQIVSTSIIGSDPFWTKVSISGSPGARPPGFSTISGVPYPVCDVSSVSADFTGTQGLAYLFSKEAATCPSVAEAGNAFLALDRRGQGRPGDVTVSGAIDCAKGCRVFGAPDLDGDGRAELAVVVVDGDAADSIEFYKVVSSDAGPVFKQVTYAGTKAVHTDWGGSANYRSGVECQRALPLPSPPPVLNFWHAEWKQGVWHLVETSGRMNGTTIRFGRTLRTTVPSGTALPAGGVTDFCGVQVRP